MKLSRFCVVLSVLSLIACASMAIGAEALVNGDFDQLGGFEFPWVLAADGGGWIGAPSMKTSATISTDVHHPNNPAGAQSGNWAIGKSYGGNLNGGNQGAYQTFATGATALLPAQIDVSGYVAGGVGAFGNFDGAAWYEVRLIEGAWSNNWDAGTLLWKMELTSEGGFNWTPVGGQLTTTSPDATLVLKFGVWDPNWDWSYFGAFFDTFSADVTIVPEPSSILALATGLAGMAGLLRKKA